MTDADKTVFGIRDVVRLRNAHGDIPAGALGSILGWFTTDLSYLVNFPDDDLPDGGVRVAEVKPDEIVRAELDWQNPSRIAAQRKFD